MVHFADVNELLQNFRLSPDVRHALESFGLLLSLAVGDDAKVARESQVIRTEPILRDKGDMLGSNSNTDIVTLSLLLRHLVRLELTVSFLH